MKEVFVINILKELSKETLLELTAAYDRYIQNANDENRYILDGWFPVCIEEFYLNDFEFWKGED